MGFRILENGIYYDNTTANFGLKTADGFQTIPVIDLSPYLKIQNVKAGSNITLVSTITGLTISSSGSGGGSTVTGATNGLSISGKNSKLGGNITGTTLIGGGGSFGGGGFDLALGGFGNSIGAFSVVAESILLKPTIGSGSFSFGASSGDVTLDVNSSNQAGDILYKNPFNILTSLQIGNDYQVLTSKNGFPVWSGITAGLNINSFNSYSASTLTNINSKLATSKFNTYTGVTATAVNSKLATVNFNSYTASTATVLNSKLSTAGFNSYTGLTATNISSKLATVNFNIYSGLTATNISSKLSTASFIVWSGTTLVNEYASKNASVLFITGTSCVLNSALNNKILVFTNSAAITVKTGNIGTGFNVSLLKSGLGNVTVSTSGGTSLNAISPTIYSQYAGASLLQESSTLYALIGGVGSGSTSTAGVSSVLFNTYTGTTAPATYESKIAFNVYTGATATVLNGKQSLITVGTVAPSTPVLNQLWIDTN